MKGSTKRKILFVGMQDSPHAARWINLVADQDWELHFFPIHNIPPHSLMRGIILHRPWIKFRPRTAIKNLLNKLFHTSSSLPPDPIIPRQAIYPVFVVRPMDRVLNRLRTGRLGESDVTAPMAYGPHVLARLIKKLKPDLIHSMEFQHAGYNVLRTKEIMGKAFPKWLATNWGSDIYYYRRFPDHNQQITRLLKNIDYYSCECERDVGLAREMGMTAKALPVFPNSGGFDLEFIINQKGNVPTSARRTIMIKGYQHFAGRALTALDALENCVDVLAGYHIILFSVYTDDVRDRVNMLRDKYRLNISILNYSAHGKMLELFANARLYVGVSISDAISTSMLEAMAMGAFPIQTHTACCEEWFKDGISGFAIPPDNVAIINQCIRQALTDDRLVDNAASLNWKTVCDRLDQKVLKEKVLDFYNRVFEDMELTRLSKVS